MKDQHPEGFDAARNKYISRSYNWEIPWQNEIIESMQEIVKAARLSIRDYSICASGGTLQIAQFDGEELVGQRAIAWLENNLYTPLRMPYGLNKIKDRVNYGYRAGSIPDCPFTGCYFDESMIETLNKSITEGYTLRDAFESLAHTASKLMEAELEYSQSEEYFLDMNSDRQYTESGVLID